MELLKENPTDDSGTSERVTTLGGNSLELSHFHKGEYLHKSGVCHLCHVTCAQCTGPEEEDCTSCPQHRLFDDGRCSFSCKKGRYAMGRQCHQCHHTCQECSDQGPNNCTSCDRDKSGVLRYLFQGECRDACPEGFYSSKRKQCESCSAHCAVCLAEERCLHCSPGHQLRRSQCVPLECSTGTMADAEDEDCVACDEGCKQCERKASQEPAGSHSEGTVCLKCDEDFYQLGTDCHHTCPDRSYSDDHNMVCVPCEDKHCEICDRNQCYWCQEPMYTFEGKCVAHCGEGYFVDEESRECEPCHRTCATCGGPQFDDCDSCVHGLTLQEGECLESGRLAPCPEKKYRDAVSGECQLCHSSCRTCFSPSKDDCRSCFSGHFLTDKSSCSSHCPPSFFANETSGRCQDCSEGCVLCKDSQQCQRCRSGLYLQQGACVVECERGFPADSGECKPCAALCLTCEEKESQCLSCQQGYLMLHHSCSATCPLGHYAKEGECRHCPPHCRDCNQDGICAKCEQYYFLLEGACVDNCPDGSFASEHQDECIRCHTDCSSCDGPAFDDCIACRHRSAVRYNGECLPKCPSSTYYDSNTNECRDCDKSCLTCSDHRPSSCLSCPSGRRRDAGGHCVWVKQCAERHYKDQDGECRRCSERCHLCSGSGPKQCLSCEEPYFLLNSTCVPKCPEGFFSDTEDGRVCARCHYSCQSCVGRHSRECSVCRPGFYKQGKSCVELCSDSHYGDAATMQCQNCDPSCQRCVGPGNDNCLSCRGDFVFMRQWGRCLSSCPQGFYQDTTTKSCHRCHPTCRTCEDEGALDCLSCYDGFRLGGGICFAQCLIGQYGVSQDKSGALSCRPCDPSCVECRGPGAQNCTMCPALQLLADDGRCLTCCGEEKRHGQQLIPRDCCNCSVSRVECVPGVNFLMRSLEELQARGGPAKGFITVCVLLILSTGAGIFLFLSARAKVRALTPSFTHQGYSKVSTEVASKATGELGSRMMDCEDEDDEEEEDADIVFMANDGTLYRKFKYGMLDQDEVELEYDDESYSYR